MSTNCLVTKLKSVVDNDNLKVLGQVKLLLTAKSGSNLSPWIKLTFAKNSHVTCTDGLRFSPSASWVTEYTFPANVLTQCTIDGSGYLVIEDKYSLTYFESHDVEVSVVVDDLSYTKMTACKMPGTNQPTGNIAAFLNTNPTLNVVQLMSNKISGNLSDVKQSILNGFTELQLASSNIEGSVNSFASGSLTTLVINNCSKLTGTVESIGNKQNITRIEINSSGVTGSIDAYVASAISSGLTSKTNLNFVGALKQLTFNGVKQDISSISINVPCFLSWDNNGKISVTTGAYTSASCTHVFCKGYTQEEAESAFQGKTIVRVDA